MSQVRALAAEAINLVLAGNSLNTILPKLESKLTSKDQALLQAIVYGVCRYYSALDYILGKFLQKPLKSKDQDIYALLLVGLYQLAYMRVSEHAAVSETVAATSFFKKPWAKGLVNAVLREYQRQPEVLSSSQQDEVVYAHPRWWIEKIKLDWPDHWQEILHNNNAHPPFALRVNRKICSRDTYLEKLKKLNLDAHIIPETEQGIILSKAIDAPKLPGFADGSVSVQDSAAQLAVSLLNLAPHLSLLDACAAPGGKLTHILETEPKLNAILSVEKDATRNKIILENIARLGLQNPHYKNVCADAATPEAWWDGNLFDRVLLDVPCSASGVIRRHPDIKLLRKPSDLASLAEEQRQLLEKCWQLLKPGGLLVYATCSIFKNENVNTVMQFMHSHPDAEEVKISADWGIACEVGRQILPGMHEMDGFYYARLKKISLPQA